MEAPRKRRRHVLVVLSSDGWVEVYAGKSTSVKIVNRLHVTSAELAGVVDEYLEGTLPRPYKRLYWPVNLRATGKVEKITPEMEADRLRGVALVRCATEVPEQRQKPQKVSA